MKHVRQLLRSALFVLMVALVGQVVQADPYDITDTVKKSFKVRPGGTLHLDIDKGNIEVTVTSDSRVLVEVERIVDTNDRDDAERVLQRHDEGLSIENRGNDVYVKSRYDEEEGFWGRWKGHNRLKVRVYVRVPERYNVDFSSGAGNVTIEDIEGTVAGRTGAGNVDILDLRGPVDISTGSGNVGVDGGTDRVEVNTGAGNVRLRNVMGAVSANTGAGNIEAEITRQPEHPSTLESGAGNVTVYLARTVSVDVNAEAGVGSASCDFPLEIEGKWMKRSFAGAINGGGPALRMRAGVGNVSLKKR